MHVVTVLIFLISLTLSHDHHDHEGHDHHHHHDHDHDHSHEDSPNPFTDSELDQYWKEIGCAFFAANYVIEQGEEVFKSAQAANEPDEILMELEVIFLSQTFLNCMDKLPEDKIKTSHSNFKIGYMFDVNELGDVSGVLFKATFPLDIEPLVKDPRLEPWFNQNGDRFIATFYKI